MNRYLKVAAGIGLMSLASVTANAAVTVSIDAGQFTLPGPGNVPIADGKTAVLLYDANNDGDFGDLTNDLAFGTPGDATVIQKWAINGTSQGAHGLLVGGTAVIDTAAFVPGRQMLLVVYNTDFSGSMTGPGANVDFVSYRSDTVDNDGQIAFFVPNDAALLTLFAYTEGDFGGSIPLSRLQLGSGNPNGGGTTVPEPAALGLLAIGAALMGTRRRIA